MTVTQPSMVQGKMTGAQPKLIHRLLMCRRIKYAVGAPPWTTRELYGHSLFGLAVTYASWNFILMKSSQSIITGGNSVLSQFTEFSLLDFPVSIHLSTLVLCTPLSS